MVSTVSIIACLSKWIFSNNFNCNAINITAVIITVMANIPITAGTAIIARDMTANPNNNINNTIGIRPSINNSIHP